MSSDGHRRSSQSVSDVRSRSGAGPSGKYTETVTVEVGLVMMGSVYI